MILQINHVRAEAASAAARQVIETLLSLAADGRLEQRLLARLWVHLDWVQYRQNFREPVMVVQTRGSSRRGSSLCELHINSRGVLSEESLRSQLLWALAPELEDTREPNCSAARCYLEEFCSFRNSIAWRFNQLYWQRLSDWEKATGRSYEQALPGGKSDANHPQAIADGVADFWTLLRDLERHNQLPAEIFALEIGVGMGKRCGLWLDRFQALDRERGTNYYARLKFLLADYALSTLERSRPAVQSHLEACSFIVLDALNPLRSLSFLRHKILHIHMTNVYDNLPDEEVARRDGRLYLVQVRAYLASEEAGRLARDFGVAESQFRGIVDRLLSVGPECLPERERGVYFWQELWRAIRLEEQLTSLTDLPASQLPEGLDVSRLEEILQDAPADLRFHTSPGAVESFRNTVPLLHPRGYLQVQDIFVTDLDDYRTGFYGPGKLDGSIVNWVNGVLLREAAERAGYDLHFAPFRYREGSRTSILYTTQRE
ncbi:MAG TPA: hypothetical protein VE077_01840 [Candidatus Methylomirabilis sp.]|nr:hypothetical protein [Candidatus Methylomirabilis sp.]